MIVKEGKVKYTIDSTKDSLYHNYKEELILESFENGKFLENEELYSKEELKEKNKSEIYKGKKYYCKYTYRVRRFFGIGLRNILISFHLNKEHVTFIHMGPPTGKELKKFKELCP